MKLPSFQFYPGDWMKDPNLSRASLQAKGALIEILCLAFECEKRGVLKTGSHAWSIEEVSRAMRGDTLINGQAIQELIDLTVLKRDKTGAIYSARQVKDDKRRKQNKKDGHLGGNPKLGKNYNKPGYLYAARRTSDKAVKIGIAINVKNRMYKLQHQCGEDKIKLIGSWWVNDMGKSENDMHEMFQDRKVIGEWFKINDLEIESIESTLKGNDKGNLRASSSASASFSSSSSSIVNNSLILERNKLMQMMRENANHKYTGMFLSDQVDAFTQKYKHEKITNLPGLVKSWMNNLTKEAAHL